MSETGLAEEETRAESWDREFAGSTAWRKAVEKSGTRRCEGEGWLEEADGAWAEDRKKEGNACWHDVGTESEGGHALIYS